jgi:hypothetical protein
VRVALLTLLLAGCSLYRADVQSVAGDDTMPGIECETAADCMLAASSCCACPDFAMPAGSPNGCDQVECPMPADCPPLVAACDQGVCTTACAPAPCDLQCDGGFLTDPNGCLACACGADTDPPSACTVDADCVEVPADCCGCAHGGSDQAVPAADAEAAAEALMCPSSPACPDVDVCDPSLVPRCLGGGCVLAPSTMDGLGSFCGTPDLPPCPDGTVCVLNADPDANQQGVGTCQAL